MKLFIALVTLLGLAACHSTDVASKRCELQRLSILSTDSSRNEIYAGRSGDIEVQFRNENAPTAADVFPDPLVTINNRATGKSCDIKDGGGIWSGKSVYLDADRRILILNEYSGANDSLIFYNPMTCERLTQIDVSNKQWAILKDRIRLGQQELTLDSRCLAQALKH